LEWGGLRKIRLEGRLPKDSTGEKVEERLAAVYGDGYDIEREREGGRKGILPNCIVKGGARLRVLPEEHLEDF